MKRITVLLALAMLAIALIVPASASAGSVGGVVRYTSGAAAGGVTVYLEQTGNDTGGTWAIRAQTITDSGGVYTFNAQWGWMPGSARDGEYTRIEAAKYIWPNGPTCRGWSSPWFMSSTQTYSRNILLGNC